MTIWVDKTYLPAISRTFDGHSQIVCAILKHKDDKSYLLARGELSFGARQMYMKDEDGEGVIPIPLTMVEGKAMQA